MNWPILQDYWRNAMNDSLEADTRPMSTQVTDSSRHNTALKAQNTASQHCMVWDTKLPCHNVLQELGFLTLVCSGNTSEIQRWNISHPEIWSISKHITKCKNTKNILNTVFGNIDTNTWCRYKRLFIKMKQRLLWRRHILQAAGWRGGFWETARRTWKEWLIVQLNLVMLGNIFKKKYFFYFSVIYK